MYTPIIIEPVKAAQELFGLRDLPLTLSHNTRSYLFQENSGIIRSGVTIEFYKSHKKYFNIIK